MTGFDWLAGTRVIDLTTAWAGPAAGRFFGAMGADVVKVESARRYDIWRGNATPASGSSAEGKLYDQAPNFLGLNRNKRGISLELTIPEGRRIFKRMVECADVMTCNFSARVLPNLGLDYATLRGINPQLILLNMPALGASGPYKDLAGYGSIIEGLGGLAARFGYLHEGARVSQTFFPDGVAGIHAALALAAALQHRRTTGEGVSIDLSQQETMWLQLGEGIVMSSLNGTPPERVGNSEPRRVPSGIFPTGDNHWVAIVVKNEPGFAAVIRAASPYLDEFSGLSVDARIANRVTIEEALGRWTAAVPLAGILEGLAVTGVRCARVNNYATGSTAPELLAVDAFEDVDHSVVGRQRYLRIPIRVDGEPIPTRRPGVRFSEHTDEVLHDWLNLEVDEIVELRRVGAIVDEIPVAWVPNSTPLTAKGGAQ